MKLAYAASLLTVSILLTGCQTTGTTASSPSSWNLLSRLKGKPAQQPSRIVAIWAPDVLNTQGQDSTQGFGGRLYFYDKQNRTIPVDGQLIIHAYDDSGDTDHTTADKKFVFTAEQLKRHHGLCELGSSYSIWIPWQPVGGTQRRISLVPTFTSTTGTRLVGHQTQNLLPGKKPAQADATQKEYAANERQPAQGLPAGRQGNNVLPTAYPNGYPAAGTQARTLDYTTTTINVPRSLSQQMRSTTVTPAGLAGHRQPVAGPTASQPVDPQSQAPAFPEAAPSAQKPAHHYRSAWVPHGTPLSSPATRRAAQASATATSPQVP